MPAEISNYNFCPADETILDNIKAIKSLTNKGEKL